MEKEEEKRKNEKTGLEFAKEKRIEKNVDFTFSDLRHDLYYRGLAGAICVRQVELKGERP